MDVTARSLRLVFAAVLALGIGGFFGARYVATSHARAPAAILVTGPILELHVPHAKGSIVLDGDMDDPGWLRETARTNAFLSADGVTPARPYSDARIVWGDGHLYVALYAADEDVRATFLRPDDAVWQDDSFHLLFTDGLRDRSLDVSPLGTIADGARPSTATPGAPRPFDYTWQSGAHVSHEMDGTLNDPSNEDEEWALELAIPFEALGLKGRKGERIGFSVHRCDTPKGGTRSCGSWGEGDRRGVLVLD